MPPSPILETIVYGPSVVLGEMDILKFSNSPATCCFVWFRGSIPQLSAQLLRPLRPGFVGLPYLHRGDAEHAEVMQRELCSVHQSCEFLRPILNDDYWKVIAVFYHQEPPIS